MAGVHLVAGGGPLPTGGRNGRPVRVHRLDVAGRPEIGDLPGGVAHRVEQLELRPVVLGHRGEVFVEGLVQELERVDRFLRPVDQDQDIAESADLREALEVPVDGDDARAEGAIGEEDPGGRRLHPRQGPGHIRHHHVLDPEQIDDGLRLLAALPLDHREVAEPDILELPEGLDAEVIAARPLVHAVVGAEAEDPGLELLHGSLEAVDHDAGDERAAPSPGGSPPPPP